MMIQIIKHTPPWVFVLFFVLLALGYFSSRTRTLSRGRVAILPGAMILLSASGVISVFGYRIAGIVAWTAGVLLAVMLNNVLRLPRGASYSAATRSFLLPGSWAPLTLMMIIFFTKYAVAVTLALNPDLNGAISFIAGVSLLYGLLSGMFFSSALTLWRLMRSARLSA